MTIIQLCKKKNNRKKKKRLGPLKGLNGSPQTKGICEKPRIATPKKPNSAQRKIVKVIISNGMSVIARIIGEGHTLQKHSMVLIRGGRANDLPGVRYTIIRGKYDSTPLLKRRTSLSKYGMKKE
jgi:small subunit ribosomal protein S12|tara:strand:+ start:1795 stop:2166 length:372 start_codon:yes stop_codon:yes gene_type:complete